jgi:SAM-dependent methyltransferase
VGAFDGASQWFPDDLSGNCTWARDHGITGVGVDISTVNVALARERAAELGVDVTFRHGDAAAWKADRPVDVASCIGATWIGHRVAGTIEILERSLEPGGLLLIGEPYWRLEPPDEETVRAVTPRGAPTSGRCPAWSSTSASWAGTGSGCPSASPVS